MVVPRFARVLLLASTLAFAVNLTAQNLSFETGVPPCGGAAGDFNHDGIPDLVSAGPPPGTTNGLISICLGNGDGTFQPRTGFGTGEAYIEDIVAADLDQDGNPDVVAVENSAAGPGVFVFFGNGDGTFQPQIEMFSKTVLHSLTVGHFFGDPWLDIAAGDVNGNVELFQNNSGRSFSLNNTIQVGPASYSGITRVREGNLDGTGLNSIAVLLPGDGVYVLWGQNDGTFQVEQLANYNAPSDLNVGNLDQDGIDDILVSYHCNPAPCSGVDVFYGQGEHQFIQNTVITNTSRAISGGIPWAVDVNGDGIGDLVLPATLSGTTVGGLGVYLGNPDGSFSQVPQVFLTSAGGGFNVVPGDWNRDGLIDFTGYINASPRAPCSNSLINDSVTVCTPSNGAYVTSPVPIQANTTDNNTVTATQQYIDDQLVYSADQPSSAQSFDLSPGTHFLVTKAWDYTGLSFRSDRVITVYNNGAPYPVCPAAPESANICLPSGDTSSSPVHILANGYAPYIPTAAQLYIDGTLVINNTNEGVSYVDTMQNLTSGDHDLVFKLWDANGNVYHAEKIITVE